MRNINWYNYINDLGIFMSFPSQTDYYIVKYLNSFHLVLCPFLRSIFIDINADYTYYPNDREFLDIYSVITWIFDDFIDCLHA